MYGGATLLMGSSLSGNQTLISKNGTFALGFFNPRATNNWYIGIWYTTIPQKAIVWVANRDNPVRNMPGVLKFSRGGQLTLFDRMGCSVWSTDNGQKGSGAVITDSGNFIVLDAHNESAIVWESFAHPTDTLLPDAKLWKGMTLTSWKSSSDPASGLYSFRMDTSLGKTELMMLFNNTVPYWSSGECIGHNYFTNVPELEGQKKVQTSCVRLSPSRIYIYFGLNPVDHMITGRFVLNENGDFELFFGMDDGRWSLRWSTIRSAGPMDCAIRMMCIVVSRASHPSTTLKVGGQLGVLGENPFNALSRRAQPTASWKPRTNTCLKKKLS
ncbi:hypothetical protein SUGI_1090600 [Cryptomeria japonica]|uniref:S-locus-specific glycoprotein S13-like n=1 Tax=Cryptomeria japonica TaxID=3369 RepID=UPI002414AECC|nr:S-locus-specific glycoprotein S13-like [Cryptomeria japonica]GLJ51276.1 hypothetical protein SUGI_1090600 [Cryptomeria japonica]